MQCGLAAAALRSHQTFGTAFTQALRDRLMGDMLKRVFVLTSTSALLASLSGCATAPAPATETAATHEGAHTVAPTATAPAKTEPVANDAASPPSETEEKDPRA